MKRYRKSVAICGYWLERIGRRLVLWRGDVGAWTLVSRDASRARIERVGFNLDCPSVREVVGNHV